MRISDWSSDVCSSDLSYDLFARFGIAAARQGQDAERRRRRAARIAAAQARGDIAREGIFLERREHRRRIGRGQRLRGAVQLAVEGADRDRKSTSLNYSH